MKKNEAMYACYGKDHAHCCGECGNLIEHRERRSWYKCKRYGTSSSLSTDWRKSWTACGKFNVRLEPGEKPMIKRLLPEKKAADQIEGQLGLLDAMGDGETCLHRAGSPT